jgi:hypothetical protein
MFDELCFDFVAARESNKTQNLSPRHSSLGHAFIAHHHHYNIRCIVLILLFMLEYRRPTVYCVVQTQRSTNRNVVGQPKILLSLQKKKTEKTVNLTTSPPIDSVVRHRTRIDLVQNADDGVRKGTHRIAQFSAQPIRAVCD